MIRRVACTFAVLLLLCAAGALSEEAPVLVAHRGLSSEVYENTIPSIIEADEHGYDAVEVDVICTSDGVLVLHHSDMVEIDNGGQEKTVFYILKEDYASVSQHILQHSTEHGDITIPKLDEALKVLRERGMKAVVHCKVHTLAFYQAVASMVVKDGMSGSCIYNIDEVTQEGISTILAVDSNARFHVAYDAFQETRDDLERFVDLSRLIITSDICTAAEAELDKLNDDFDIYLWNVLEGDLEKALQLKPQYIEFADGVALEAMAG